VGQVWCEQPEGSGSCTLPRTPHSKQHQVAVVGQAQPGVRILMHARLAAGRPAAGALLVHGMIAWMCVAPPLRQCMRLHEHCGHGWQWGTQVLGPGCALVAGGPVAPHWVHSCCLTQPDVTIQIPAGWHVLVAQLGVRLVLQVCSLPAGTFVLHAWPSGVRAARLG
jgi:hypothetical protein